MRAWLCIVDLATAGLVLICSALLGTQQAFQTAQNQAPSAPAQDLSLSNGITPLLHHSISSPSATIVVTNTNDRGIGSLRQAIIAAQDGDTIQFDPALNGQTIILTTGELFVNKSLTITGPGSNLLTIMRDAAAPAFRLFHIQGTATVLIGGLTITGGYSTRGGGIYNENNLGTLTISDCVLTNNSAGAATPVPTGTPSPFGLGGGISTFVPFSGAAQPAGGTTAILRSTISHNTASSTGHGGGIDNVNSTVTITDSTISNNVAIYGAIECELGPVQISNSTISDNNNSFAGIYNTWIVQITNGTLSNNSIQDSGGILELTNTILNNSPIGNSSGDAHSHGYNISSDNAHGYLTGPGDQINTNPMLGPLQDNGGPNFTHGLLPGSPAIDAGDPNFVPPPSTDQRGYPRVYNGRIDKGSFELQPTPTTTPTSTATSTIPPTPTATAPPPTPTVTPGYVRVFLEGFDAVTPPALPPGWTTSFANGPADCMNGGTCSLGSNWATTNVNPQTASNAAFHDAPTCVTDSYLDTPPIFIPSTFYSSEMYFTHKYDLENGHDGGVLELSIEGGPFTDIVAAGGTFSNQTGYNGTISTAFLSPIAGRQAWSGTTSVYTAVGVYLPTSTRGHNVVFRFRLATDCAVGRGGWYIDSMEINHPYDPTPTATATFTPTATASPTVTATATATAAITPCPPNVGYFVLEEFFDGVTAPALPAGWSATNAVGPAPLWVTSTTMPSSSPNDVFIDDPGTISDKRLDTPEIPICVSAQCPVTVTISFNNFYDLENTFDGGVLEVSSPNINGGAFTDITDPAVGGQFILGAYNATIATDRMSPIAGRRAWSGNSGGYSATQAQLGGPVVGHYIKLRFRMASDNSGSGTGWRVDNIQVGVFPAGKTPCPPTPTATATATATIAATPTPTATPSPNPAQPLNLSTRILVQTGDQVGIGGFIITGSTPKQVVVRGIGPSLSGVGISNPLADPVLELHGSTGSIIITNDNWMDAPNHQQIMDLGLAPSDPLESAILIMLDPGAYTAVVRGNDNGTGIGLIEVYDVSPAATSQLGNISTRAFVGTGGDVLIGGFILGGGTNNTDILIRGLGPSLCSLGILNCLPDPTLELHDVDGAPLGPIGNCALPPPDPREPCVEMSLPPGTYTTILSGNSGDTGVGLIEIYNLQ